MSEDSIVLAVIVGVVILAALWVSGAIDAAVAGPHRGSCTPETAPCAEVGR